MTDNAEKSPRILIIPSWYPPDGGYFFKEHSEAILKKGWQVDVLVNRVVGVRKMLAEGNRSLQRGGIRIENGLRVLRSVFLKLPGSEKMNIRRWARSTRKRYSAYAQKFGPPDLILVHSVTWAGFAAYLIRKKYEIPYVIVEHRSFFVWSTPEAREMVRPYYLPFFQKAYRNCSRLVPVSESLMTGLRTLMPWIDEKVEVIPNMIREEMFRPPSSPRKAVPFVFFWAGRLEHVKGIDLLLEATSALASQSDTPFSVRLAGRGSLRKQLEDQAESLGIGERVTFLGRISREEIQQEMQTANCFVLPTRYEAFGAVLIEAMATGLPVIATRSGGPQFIIDDTCGILIDPDTIDQLTGAMARMIRETSSFDPERIRQKAIMRFGEQSVMERYHRLFQEIITTTSEYR
ncbi:MAG: glycosyltransferase [Bacteroidales bacterium]